MHSLTDSASGIVPTVPPLSGASQDESQAPILNISPRASITPEEGGQGVSGLLRSATSELSPSAAWNLALSAAQENQLAMVRLGIASSLFRALRWKHEPTARHCLRVALGCSSWAARLGLPGPERDALELAALLHDVGKLGIPDTILAKPAPLSPQEAAVMNGHWLIGLDIVGRSCSEHAVMTTMAAAAAWHDGSRPGAGPPGEAPSHLSRMLAIVDAFDSITTHQIYRRALSRERAMEELYAYAGSQFDPTLVNSFARLHECDLVKLQEAVARRWLHGLDPDLVNQHWRLADEKSSVGMVASFELFHEKLLASMYDAVVFVDSSLRVLFWNRGAERITGISSAGVVHRQWQPQLIGLRDENGRKLSDSECPLLFALRAGIHLSRRLAVRGRHGRDIAVDAQLAPVMGTDGAIHGVTMLLHDVSPEISLEQRCQSLQDLATRDPLTQVANRSEFDRVHSEFVYAHLQNRLPCSLIICDIDRFKRINDTFGHQAGDQVIQNFARLLQSACRPGDLVARYGGEEFVLLCADCDNQAAVKRAEDLRQSFAALAHPAINGRSVTASFGVTEVQPGDTPETMLRRADRALLQAKDEGRDRVVQLGVGTAPVDSAASNLRPRGRGTTQIEQAMVTPAPLSRTIEKLRGFIADHDAHIISADTTEVVLDVQARGPAGMKRSSDRPIRFIMEIRFEEERVTPADSEAKRAFRTHVDVLIRPRKHRERRQAQLNEHARNLIASFRTYLVAEYVGRERASGMLGRARSLFESWWERK